MRVLVTGGAGYIGSHTLVALLTEGHEALVIDNLSNGHEEALSRVKQLANKDFGFVKGDIRDSEALNWSATLSVHDATLSSWNWQSQNPDGYAQ